MSWWFKESEVTAFDRKNTDIPSPVRIIWVYYEQHDKIPRSESSLWWLSNLVFRKLDLTEHVDSYEWELSFSPDMVKIPKIFNTKETRNQ